MRHRFGINSTQRKRTEMSDALRLFAGMVNPALAELNSRQLQMSLRPCTIERFPVGEASARLAESVRGLRGLHYRQGTESQRMRRKRAPAQETGATTAPSRIASWCATCVTGDACAVSGARGDCDNLRWGRRERARKESAPHELRDREEEDGRAIEQAAVSRPDRGWQIT